MSLLDQKEVNRIVLDDEFASIGTTISEQELALRCNTGRVLRTSGAGYNLSTDRYGEQQIWTPPLQTWATALYASICLSQDTIQSNMQDCYLILAKYCALGGGETYQYNQGQYSYVTLPKCNVLGPAAKKVYEWPINDSAINLARRIVDTLLSMTHGSLA